MGNQCKPCTEEDDVLTKEEAEGEDPNQQHQPQIMEQKEESRALPSLSEEAPTKPEATKATTDGATVPMTTESSAVDTIDETIKSINSVNPNAKIVSIGYTVGTEVLLTSEEYIGIRGVISSNLNDDGHQIVTVAETESVVSVKPIDMLKVQAVKHPSNVGKPELQGISVYALRHIFLAEVEATKGLSRESKIYEIEDLKNPTPGVIRRKGLNTRCPVNDRMGAAYVHCLKDNVDHVSDATHMLSYTWGYIQM